MTVRKILVPVDFSRQSAEALSVAADLSRRYEAALEIVHVLNRPTYALPEGFVVPTPEQSSSVVAKIESRLAESKKEALDAGAFKVEVRVLQGFPTTEILQVAKEEEPDLIVMGTHGRTGIEHLVIGSVAEDVVRLAPCPVLTTRALEVA